MADCLFVYLFMVTFLFQRLYAGHPASGIGLTADWFKLVGTKAPRQSDCPDLPQNNFAAALKNFIDIVWEKAEIPAEVNITEVVSIPKKGDLSLTDNYRRISLINVSVKIVTSVVISRLSKYVEKHSFISKAQAGFRPREEVVAQIVSLYEEAD